MLQIMSLNERILSQNLIKNLFNISDKTGTGSVRTGTIHLKRFLYRQHIICICDITQTIQAVVNYVYAGFYKIEAEDFSRS